MGVNLATFKTRAFGLSAAYAGRRRARCSRSPTASWRPSRSRSRCRSRSWPRSWSAGSPRWRARCSGRCSSSSCPSGRRDVDEALSGVIYGATLIACMYVFRGGIMGLLRSAWARVVEVQGSTNGRSEDEVAEVAVAGADRARWRWCRRRAVVTTAAAAGAAAAPRRTPASPRRRSSSAARIPSAVPRRPTATIGEGAKAYFKFLNAKGGVNGRKIDFIDARRRLRAAEGAAERAPARRSRTRSSRCSTRSARRTTSRSGTSSTSRRCRSSTSPPARPPGARTSRRTRTRSAGSRTTSPRPRSTRTTSRRTKPNAKVAVLLPERRLRQGPARRLRGGHRGLGRQGRQEGDLQRHRPDGRRPGRAGSRARGPTRS